MKAAAKCGEQGQAEYLPRAGRIGLRRVGQPGRQQFMQGGLDLLAAQDIGETLS